MAKNIYTLVNTDDVRDYLINNTELLDDDESMTSEKYLYFCAKEPESGELYFSKTLDQHRRAVEVYAPYWQKYDQDRGIR